MHRSVPENGPAPRLLRTRLSTHFSSRIRKQKLLRNRTVVTISRISTCSLDRSPQCLPQPNHPMRANLNHGGKGADLAIFTRVRDLLHRLCPCMKILAPCIYRICIRINRSVRMTCPSSLTTSIGRSSPNSVVSTPRCPKRFTTPVACE